MFRCPVCRLPLERGDRVWRCGSGHSYDEAREGYVNLLITHQRRQRDPGDSPDMLRHRRAFLDGGHYRPLADAVAAHVAPGMSVLDAGCGEGYYSREWPARHEGVSLWGVDIAKPAVRMAAKRAVERAHYAVASVYDVPVVDTSIDLAVSIFAPLHSPEFERVLRPTGRVVTVIPGPDHLDGLKARLFATPEPHPETGPFEREGATTALVPAGRERVRYAVTLTPPAIADLVGMTPYAWYVDADTRASISSLPSLSTTFDFLIFSYQWQNDVSRSRSVGT